jgi:hypothetical protein
MKTKATCLVWILLTCLGFLRAQTDTLNKKPFMKWYSIGLNFGALLNSEPLSTNALMKMDPANKLLQQDYALFAYNNSNNADGFNAGLQTGFIFRDRSKKSFNNKQELRIGFYFQSLQGPNITYTREDRTRFDTLISYTNPKVYYIDTVKKYTHHIQNEQSNYLVDLSYIIFLRPQNKIFSAYLGAGIGYGSIFQNYVKVDVRYNERFEDQNGKTYSYYTKTIDSGSEITENTELKQSNIYQGAVNGGILLRFSNIKKNRASQFAINIDGKGGLRLSDLPNIGMYKQLFFNINFGVKFYLNREPYK